MQAVPVLVDTIITFKLASKRVKKNNERTRQMRKQLKNFFAKIFKIKFFDISRYDKMNKSIIK